MKPSRVVPVEVARFGSLFNSRIVSKVMKALVVEVDGLYKEWMAEYRGLNLGVNMMILE